MSLSTVPFRGTHASPFLCKIYNVYYIMYWDVICRSEVVRKDVQREWPRGPPRLSCDSTFFRGYRLLGTRGVKIIMLCPPYSRRVFFSPKLFFLLKSGCCAFYIPAGALFAQKVFFFKNQRTLCPISEKSAKSRWDGAHRGLCSQDFGLDPCVLDF